MNTQTLYIFLDEGGNFDFSANGTRHLTLTSLAMFRPFATLFELAKLKYDLLEKGETIEFFHASEDRWQVRYPVFETLKTAIQKDNSLQINSVILDKAQTANTEPQPEHVYPNLMLQLIAETLKNIAQPFEHVFIITDTLPMRRQRSIVKRTLHNGFKRLLPANIPFRVFHHHSMSTFGLQAVDYCNWAIFRKWERQQPRDAQIYKAIAPAICSERLLTAGMKIEV